MELEGLGRRIDIRAVLAMSLASPLNEKRQCQGDANASHDGTFISVHFRAKPYLVSFLRTCSRNM